MADDKKGSNPLADHFDKMILAAALIAAAVYGYMAYSDKGGGEKKRADLLISRVNTELGRPHPEEHPKEGVDLAMRTKRAWEPPVRNFDIDPWSSAYATEVKLKEGVDRDYVRKIREANTEWFLPKLSINEPTVSIDRVKVTWSVLKPPADSLKAKKRGQGRDPEDVYPQKFHKYAEFIVKRQTATAEGGGKWEVIHKAKSSHPPFRTYGFEDKAIQPKTTYAYRVIGVGAKKPVYGKLLQTERTTTEVSTRTQDIWFVELRYILPPAGDKPERAKILVRKFDLTKGMEFGPMEFDVFQGDTIGVLVEIGDDFREKKITKHMTPVPGSTEKELIEWNTRFKVVKVERGIPVTLKIRRTKEDGSQEIRERKTTSDRIVYKDDEGKEHMVWPKTKNPDVVHDEKPKEKKSDGKKKGN